MFCFCFLEILIILTLNLYCICEVWWDIGVCLWVEEICSKCMFITLSCLFICIQYLQYPISTEFLWLYYVWEFSETQSKFKVILLCLQLSKCEHWQLPMISIEPELASEAERKQWSYKKHERPRNPIIFFLICVTSMY